MLMHSNSPTDNPVMTLGRNERGVIVNWLVKILLVCAIPGIVIFDAGSIATNFFGLDGVADDTALAVATSIQSGEITPNPRLLEQTAREVAHPAGARVAEVTVDLEGVVHVTLKRDADT